MQEVEKKALLESALKQIEDSYMFVPVVPEPEAEPTDIQPSKSTEFQKAVDEVYSNSSFKVAEPTVPADPWIPIPEEAAVNFAPDIMEDEVPKEKKDKKKLFKADKMINGFMIQSDPISPENEDPFWMEVHVLGKNEFYISGGYEGKLNVDELKMLRKNIKQVLNQEEGSFVEGDKEFDGGKAIIKVDGPWVPNELQTSIATDLIMKKLKKWDDEENDTSSSDKVEQMVKIFTTLFAQMGHVPTNPDTTTTGVAVK